MPGVAPSGAVSRPSHAAISPFSELNESINPPPPMPLDCGSTRPRTIWAAMAASTAEPPERSISSPASAASGFAAAIMCFSDFSVAAVVLDLGMAIFGSAPLGAQALKNSAIARVAIRPSVMGAGL